jgi:hypothetical protein
MADVTAGARVKVVASAAGVAVPLLTESVSTRPEPVRPAMVPPIVCVAPLLLLLPLLELLLELELLLLELLLPLLELLPLELLLELELLELLLELELLELLLLEGVTLSLPPPQAATTKVAQRANVSARTDARLRWRERIEYIGNSSIGLRSSSSAA